MNPALAVATLALVSIAGACDDPGRPGAVYVASGATDRIFRLDARTGALLDTIATDPRLAEMDEPHGLAVSPDGRSWYVTLSHGDASLWRFDRADDRRVGRVTLGTAGAARIGFAAGRAFIPDYDRTGAEEGGVGEVAVVALDDLTVVDRLRLCAAPHDARATVGGPVAITCSMSDEVVLVDPATLAEIRRFPSGPSPGAFGTPVEKPLNLAWSPDADRLYVSLHLADAVRVYDPDGAVLGTWPVGARPAQLAVSPDGAVLVVASRGAGTATAMDTETGAALWVVDAGAHPHGIALDDDGAVAFIAAEGTTTTPGVVTAIRVADGALLWRAELGSYLLGIAYAP